MLNFILPLSANLPIVFYVAMGLFIAVTVAGFFLVKYHFSVFNWFTNE